MNIAKLIVTSLALLLTSPTAWAQVAAPSDPSDASDGPARIHRIDFAANYLEEAEACDIPDAISETVRGTMSIGPARHDAHDDHARRRVHAVREINWLVTNPHGSGRVTEETLVTGSGRYIRTDMIGDATIPGHRLMLTLRLGDELVRFDSGLVPNGHNADGIDIVVREVNDDYLCVRRYFRVVSSAVGAEEIHPYAMGNAAYFGFQFAPDSQMLISAIGGRLGVIELPIEPDTPAPGGITEWAVVRLAAHGGGTADHDPPVAMRGGGVYLHFTATFTGVPIERMFAEFAIGGPLAPPHGHPLRFDSGIRDSGWPGPTNHEPLPFFHLPLDDTDPAFPRWHLNLVAGALHSGG